jgi:uncharacterized membrane protein
MQVKTYRNWRITVMVIIGVAVALSVAIGNVCAILLAVAIGMILLFILQKRVKGVIRDERTDNITYKATRLTFSLFGIGMPLAGAIMVAIGWDTPDSALRQSGDALLYATCALLAVYILAHLYFNRKMGGGKHE